MSGHMGQEEVSHPIRAAGGGWRLWVGGHGKNIQHTLLTSNFRARGFGGGGVTLWPEKTRNSAKECLKELGCETSGTTKSQHQRK